MEVDLRKFVKAEHHSIYDREITASGTLAIRPPEMCSGWSTCNFCGNGGSSIYSTFGINWGGIRDHLIRLAAHFTENHASDLLYDLATVERDLNRGVAKPEGYFFGFRPHGVDGNGFVALRYEPKNPNREYRAIWRLTVTIDKSYGAEMSRNVEMSLHRVRYNPYIDREVGDNGE